MCANNIKFKKAISLAILVFIFSQSPGFAKDPTPGSIIIYGDSRTNDMVHEEIANSIIKVKPEVIFHTGDIVDNGSDPQDWVIPMKIISKLKAIAEFYPAIGNRESNTPYFAMNFRLPNNGRWYSVERQGIHFIVLDTNSSIGPVSMQYKWLVDDLESVKDRNKFIVVIMHHPIFSTGYHSGKKIELTKILVPLFEKYGVDIVFSGHDHDYERSLYENIYYIVTGGGGANLYGKKNESPYSQFFIREFHFCQLCRRGNKLAVTVFDMYFNVLDEFVVKKKSAQSARAPILQTPK